MSGTNYPVTQCHFPEEWNLSCCCNKFSEQTTLHDTNVSRYSIIHIERQNSIHL